MTPFSNSGIDSRSDPSLDTDTANDRKDVSPPLTKSKEPSRDRATWRQLFGQLTRTTVRGNVQPSIGQMCLIMTGIAGQDAGQMGVVTSRSKVMVDITMAHQSGKGTVTKSKHVRSLILLEPGLVLEQDQAGSVWVRRSTSGCPQQEENSEHGG
jgi:hypothetical protein